MKNLLHAALAAAILYVCFGPVAAWSQEACASPTMTKQYGLDFINTQPGVEATEIREAPMAQSLYATYQKIAERPLDKAYMEKIDSAFVVSMEQFGYYGIVFYDAGDCEIGHASPLNKGQIDDLLKAWAADAGEDA